MGRVYHTNIKIRYVLGLLTPEECRQIPSSTRAYWLKNLKLDSIFGILEQDMDVESMRYFLKKKYLVQTVYVLQLIEITMHIMFKQIPDRQKLFRNCSSQIVETIDKIKGITGFKRALNILMISKQQYYYWKSERNCSKEPLNLCQKFFYNQLTYKEINAIQEYTSEPSTIHWSLNSVYFKMLIEKAAFMSINTFYKYAKMMGITAKRKRKKKKKWKGFKAKKPLDYLHMDITEVKLKDNLKVFVSFVSDNYSKALLGWQLATTKKADISVKNIDQILQKHNLKDKSLVVDRGSENKGALNEFLFLNRIRKLISLSKDFVFSNSAIEAINKKFKYEYLKNPELLTYQQFIKVLEFFEQDYNNRPHGSLLGKTPLKVLSGEVPDKYLFSEEIRNAAAMRRKINQAGQCNACA